VERFWMEDLSELALKKKKGTECLLFSVPSRNSVSVTLLEQQSTKRVKQTDRTKCLLTKC
jgi:hypothetical protein